MKGAGALVAIMSVLSLLSCQELTDSEGTADQAQETEWAETCAAARDVQSSFDAGDAEAAAEDARELTRAANRAGTGELRPRLHDAEEVRAAMVDWAQRQERAEERHDRWEPDEGQSWAIPPERDAPKRTEETAEAMETLDGLLAKVC